MKRLARAQFALALLLSVAFGVRLAAAVWWQARLPPEQPFGFSDSQGYWALAQTIVRGEPYQYGSADARVFRTPGYPLVLAGLFLLVGDDPPVLWARGFGALLGTLVVGEVFWLASLLFDRTTAWWAGALVAFYPGAVATSTFVLSEALFCPLFILQLIVSVYAWQASRRLQQVTWGIGVGLVAGLATLARPSWLLFTPLVHLLPCFVSTGRIRSIMIGAGAIVGLTCALLPWWVRNYSVVGRFVPTTLQVGASLYDGWNPAATGASDMRFVARYEQLLRQDPTGSLSATADDWEYRLNRRLQDDALQWASGHPGRVLQLAGVKVLRMWRPVPNADEFQDPLLRFVLAVTFTPLTMMSLIGALRFGGRSWPLASCWLPAVYFTLLHVVFVSSIRYREPVMLALIVLAAGALAAMLPAWPRPRINTLPEGKL